MFRLFFDPEKAKTEYKKILAHVTGRLSYSDLFQLMCNDSFANKNLASAEYQAVRNMQSSDYSDEAMSLILAEDVSF